MDDAELLAHFDTQVRRNLGEPPPGFEQETVTDPGAMTLLLPSGDAPWGGGVFWCDLDESTADAAIAAAIERFRPYGVEFEWKHYGYDRPADLAQRLLAAGFSPEEEEALVVGEVDVVRDRLDLVVSIAQYGSTRSINVGAAAAIAMHTWVRQHVTGHPL